MKALGNYGYNKGSMMKVVTYNIQFGLGKDGRNDLHRIAGTVAGADIIALQEVERNWEHSGHVDQPERLASYLPDYYWVYGPYFDVDASRANPDGTIGNARRQFGNMVLAKTPIVSTRLFPLPKSATVDQRNMAVGMLEAVVGQGRGKALRVYNTHLSAKSSKDRLTQIRLIRDTIARAPSEGSAWTGSSPDPIWREDRFAPPMPEEFVLLGDFNHGPDDPEYRHLIQSNDRDSDLLDCWTLTGNALGKGATYTPAADPENGSRIDFAFVGHRLKKRVGKAWIDSEAQGSDHQPYWISIDDA
jgi:endonuclease/exonuclease/phosphatase family metal-dependent hydrolase